jgi:uncharacterized protein (TIGR02270 family)
MTDLGYPGVFLHIVEQHFEELDFLWEQRERIVFAANRTLSGLAEHEARADTHLDGLRIAEGHAVDLVRPALTGGETFAATAAALVFMEMGRPELVREVLAAFESGEARDGIRIALRHVDLADTRETLLGLSNSDDLSLAVAAADVLAFHRIPVEDARRLTHAEEPAARVLGYGVLGRMGALREASQLREGLADEAPSVHAAALRAAAMSGLGDLDALCRTAATDAEAPNRDALRFLGILGNPSDRPTLESAARQADSASAALEALGALGDVRSVPVLIDVIEDAGDGSEAAVDALVRITGLQRVPLAQPKTPEDAAEASDADEPGPDVDFLREWWLASSGHFSPEARWQAGVAVEDGMTMPPEMPLQLRRDLVLLQSTRLGGMPAGLELEARASRQQAT